jgi:5'-nucleotidase
VIISGARSLSDTVQVSYGTKTAATTDVHVLAFNDLHGNLEAASNIIYGQFAGGAAYLAKAVKDRQAQYGKLQATVLAGDNIGASPLANGLFFEEPITIASNLMNVDFASVGNHEFDKGSAELLRIQRGGCHPTAGCTGAPYALADKGGDDDDGDDDFRLGGRDDDDDDDRGNRTTNRYPGADFQYLSANVVVTATGRTLLPAYGTKKFKAGKGKSFKVGFIGEVLEATPTIVTPTGVAGLTFQDEADAANLAVQQLRRKGVKVPILVVHEGGFQSSGAALNGCAGNLANSPIAEIAGRLDPAIKVIVSAHTHAEYRCTITAGGVTRLITSASSFGRILSDITLTIDDKTGELVQASAQNTIVTNAQNAPAPPGQPAVVRIPDLTKEDPQVQAVVNQYVTASAPLANRVIGKIQGDLTRTASPFGESALGDVIADAQLVATQPASLGGAQLAFMNPGGIRGDLLVSAISSGGEAPGEVTYGEAFTVQPFGNSLVTKTMTGDMIRRLLEQQFSLANPTPGGPNIPCQPGGTAPVAGRFLQISSTFKYESNPSAATCAGKIGRMWVGGVLVEPTSSFRVTMNNFLAAGGDGFTVFNEGTSALGGAQDIDAFVEAFTAAGAAGIAVPPLNRIVAIP